MVQDFEKITLSLEEDRTYSVTWYYNRYLIWKRNRVFYGMLFSFATPIVVSIITSVLTVIVLNKLGLK